jgi:hypothetical protein
MNPVRSGDPEFIDRLLEQDVAFRDLVEDRRREAGEGRVAPLEEVRRRLDAAAQPCGRPHGSGVPAR